MLARTIRLGTNHLQGIQDVLVFSARLLFGNSSSCWPLPSVSAPTTCMVSKKQIKFPKNIGYWFFPLNVYFQLRVELFKA